jgi:hypothetical protein
VLHSIGAKPGNFLNEALGAQQEAEERVDLSGCDRSDHLRVGEWGGHMLVDCDDPLTIHKFCSMLPAFVFQVHPVVRVEDAVRGELEVIAWRDSLKGR